jgi:hypothetical protein
MHVNALIQWSMSAGGGASVQYRRSWSCERERFPGRQLSVSLPHLRLAATWDNGVEHSGFLCFADTEEVTGSNPVAPTSKALTSGNAPRARGSVRRHRERRPLTVWDEVHGVGSSILVTGPLTSTFVDPALSGAGGRGAQRSENALLHSHRRAPGPRGGVRPGRPGSTSVTLPLGDCEPVAPGYHHPWRLVHRSRTSDIRAITTSSTASCTTWVRSLTITFIP